MVGIRCPMAVRTIGTNPIPILLRILRAKDSGLHRIVMELMENQDLLRVSMQSSEEQKQEAGAGLYLLRELATKDNTSIAYMNAGVELRALKGEGP